MNTLKNNTVDKIRNSIKEYNKKVKYLQEKKNNNIFNNPPTKIKPSTALKKIKTEKQAKEYIKNLNNFINPPIKGTMRITENDKMKLTKAVRNFNRKITKEVKKFGADIGLPSKIKEQDILYGNYTRYEFNKLLKNMEKFSKDRNIKYTLTPTGAILTQWEYNLLKQKENKIERIKNKELKNINPELPKERKIQYENYINEIYHSIDIDKIKPSFISNAKEILDFRTKKNYIATLATSRKQSYIEGLYNMFDYRAKELIDLVKMINEQVFLNTIYSNEILSLQYIYSEEALTRKYKLIRQELMTLYNTTVSNEDEEFTLEEISDDYYIDDYWTYQEDTDTQKISKRKKR